MPKHKPQYRMTALGAVTFFPSYSEAVKAASYLAPEVLVTLHRPDGKAVFTNAAAREVTGLGRPLGALLRQKRQAIRHR